MKDMLCSYYTNSEDMISYMAARLRIEENDIVLEPSAGEGIFIDKILSMGKNIAVDALDMDEKAVAVLREKYQGNPAVTVRRTDTLLDRELDLYDTGKMGGYGHYTKVIGNPPYGAWQNNKKRSLLKEKYLGHYVRETYSLFLLRCISVLKIHGRLSFIIPDTFLYLNMHSRLREVLLTKTRIEEILIFPSRFFPGVSFGYSNLSIITLERCKTGEAGEHKIRIVQGFRSSAEFQYVSCYDNSGNGDGNHHVPGHLKKYDLKQADILKKSRNQFFFGENTYISLLSSEGKTLGDIADIATGFCTGNNRKFIRVLNGSVKRAKGYQEIEPQKIYDCISINGIDAIEGYVPYIKGASKRRYLRSRDEWFIKWDSSAVRFYHTDKKTRFQNASFYFKTGIGIPMVKSGTVRAFLMENRIFDQSIVGIFPKNAEDLYYLLALMNSDIINHLIHIINPTANNSANYVKQLPYLEPSAEWKCSISSLVKQILMFLRSGREQEALKNHEKINHFICEIYHKK